MKALSLTQPWASAVVEGFKEYETRSWATKYRGPIAIHASKGFPRVAKALLGLEDDADEPMPHIRGTMNRPPEEMPTGAILGIVNITDCQETWAMMRQEFISEGEHAFGDWEPGRYAWKLEGVIWLSRPVPAKGSLGLWTVPPDIEKLVNEDYAMEAQDDPR